jgi:hypothetical protein
MATTNTICQVSTCAFHHPDGRCAAGQVSIQPSQSIAYCDTFSPRDVNKQPASGSSSPQMSTKIRPGAMGEDSLNINLASTSHLHEGDSTNLTPLVGCNANKCMYNEHSICFADKISITGSSADTSQNTRCDTYSPK